MSVLSNQIFSHWFGGLPQNIIETLNGVVSSSVNPWKSCVLRGPRTAYILNNSLWVIMRHPPSTWGIQRGIHTPPKALQHENRFPLSITRESHTLKRHIFLGKHVRHANTCTHTHIQLYTCGKSQSFLLTLVHTWHMDSSTSLHQWSFSLRWRETSYTRIHTTCTGTHSQGNPLTYSHAPALCKCQTVGEGVYLGALWYFYTFQ